MKKILVFFGIIFLFVGCANKPINNNLNNNEVNNNEVKETDSDNTKNEENVNINDNSQQNSNTNNNNVNSSNKTPQKKPSNKNENVSKNEENTDNKKENDDTIEDTTTNETTKKYTYVKDAITKQICPAGYSDKFDGKNCYKYAEATKTWSCLGKVIDGICYDTGVIKEYYCNGNDMYWEAKENGIVKERLCRRYVLDIINSDALGNCPDGYTLNDENKCEGYVHTMENKYQALIKYTCKDGYTPYENTCIKKSEYSYIYSCPEGYDYNSVSCDKDCYCYDIFAKADYVQKLTCENDNLVLMNGKCYSIK